MGWNLRRIKVRRGYSIEALAGDAEVDPSHVVRIERGTVNSSLDVLERLARVLDLKPLDLFRLHQPGIKPPKPFAERATAESVMGLKAGCQRS